MAPILRAYIQLIGKCCEQIPPQVSVRPSNGRIACPSRSLGGHSRDRLQLRNRVVPCGLALPITSHLLRAMTQRSQHALSGELLPIYLAAMSPGMTYTTQQVQTFWVARDMF